MSLNRNDTIPKSQNDNPENNSKDVSLAQNMNLNITNLKHDVLLSIRIKRNQLPHVVKSLAEITSDIREDISDAGEAQKTEDEIKAANNNPNPVIWITDKIYLTATEIKIMERLILGRENKEIATDLNLQECTIKNNLQRIFRKFRVNNRSEAILEYLKCKERYKKVS